MTIATMTRLQAARMGFRVRMLSDRKFYVEGPPEDVYAGRALPVRRHGGYHTEQEALDDLAVKWLARYRAEARVTPA